MSKKKKTYDQKIEEYTEKLKIAQREKKEFIEKKGRQLWTKIKTPFMEKERAIETLLVDKDKLNILVEGIKKILDSFSFEVNPIDTTNVNEMKKEKEEKNDTGQ
ncbi:cell division protein FtsQ [Fusobacterium animalis ATCC 51191]|uniref:Cell division protein FtsQ n=2 Tax=Fusobacterium TaxID=848 RepID=F9EPM3_9FUSO|nr:cell division protein FtsQ [Fusobacterium animalis ATCC 51191]